MKLFIIFLLIYSVKCYHNIKVVRRYSRKLRNKILYCPYIRGPRDEFNIKYTESVKNINKQLKYVKVMNRRNLREIYDDKLLDDTITTSSVDFSDLLLEELKTSLVNIIEINKEYITLISLILSQIIRFNINEKLDDKRKLKDTFFKIAVRNILIPMAIHDIFQLLIIYLKNLINNI